MADLKNKFDNVSLGAGFLLPREPRGPKGPAVANKEALVAGVMSARAASQSGRRLVGREYPPEIVDSTTGITADEATKWNQGGVTNPNNAIKMNPSKKKR